MPDLPPVGARVQTKQFGSGVVVERRRLGGEWPRPEQVRVRLYMGGFSWLTADEIAEVLDDEATS